MVFTYATIEEFKARNRRNLPAGITDEEIGYQLQDATVFIRGTISGIPGHPGDALQDALRVVTIAVAKRALLAEKNAEKNDGASSVTDTAGPFSTTQQFRNSEGNFYISSQERMMIENELARETGNRSFKCITAEGW